MNRTLKTLAFAIIILMNASVQLKAQSDDCDSPPYLTVSPTVSCSPVTGTTVGAAASNITSTCNGEPYTGNGDVFYGFIATSTRHAISVVALTPGLDGQLMVLSSCEPDAMLGCADNNAGPSSEMLSLSGFTVGQHYRVRYACKTAVQGTFSICIKTPDLDNDECTWMPTLTAQPAGSTCVPVYGSDFFAFESMPAGPCNVPHPTFGGVAKDVWYKFQASSPLNIITVNATSADFDPVVEVRTAACSGTLLQCSNASTGGTELATYNWTIGALYYIRVYGSMSSSGNFTICATTAPPNNECSGVIALTPGPPGNSCSGTDATNIAATASGGNFTCASTSGPGYDVWFSFMATASTHYVVVDPDYQLAPVLELRDGCAGNVLTCSQSGVGSTVMDGYSGLIVGQTYYVRVGGRLGTMGNFNICVKTPLVANDDCGTATVIISTPLGAPTIPYPATCVGATTSFNAINCLAFPLQDVWFVIANPDVYQTIRMDVPTGVIGIIELMNCGSSTYGVGCASSPAPGEPAVLNGQAPFSDEMIFRAYFQEGAGAFTITATQTAIPEDNCNHAVELPIGGLGQPCQPVNGDNTHATSTNIPLSSCGNGPLNTVKDVFYEFHPFATTHTITATGATIDGVLEVRTSCNGTLVGCVDDAGVGGTESITLNGLAGDADGYSVRYYGNNGSSGPFTICVSSPIATNDDCAGAIELFPSALGAACTPEQGSTYNATAGGSVCAGSAASPDVWYKFTATASAYKITLSNYANVDMDLQVMSGSCGTLQLVACVNNAVAGGQEVAQLSGLTYGATYWLLVKGHGQNDYSSFNICVATVPDNDECAGAFTLVPMPNTTCTPIPGSTGGATGSLPASTCSGYTSAIANDVWYKFTATAGTHTITASSASDGVLELRSSSCPTAPITCADNTGSGGTESITQSGLNIGQVYYLRYYHYGGAQGSFNLCVTTTAPTNDECSGAVTLTMGQIMPGTSTAATQSLPTASCDLNTGGFPAMDVWYQFVATSTSHILSATSEADGVLELRSGGCAGSVLACMDVTGAGMTETIVHEALTVGATYHVRYYVRNGGGWTFEIGVRPGLTNNECSGAIMLTSGAAPQTFTSELATQSYTPSVCSGSTTNIANDVFFAFTATSAIHLITVTGLNGFDPVLDYRNIPCSFDPFSECVDATAQNGTESFLKTAYAVGFTYKFRVYGWAGSTGSFTVSVSTPLPGDLCENAILITPGALGADCSPVPGNMAGMTFTPAANTCFGGVSYPDMWFKFVATGTVHRISLHQTTSWARMELRDGCAGTPLACDEGGAFASSPVIAWSNLTVGNTYYVRVLGGFFEFSLCLTSPVPELNARVMLQGAYDSNTGLMRDVLRTLPDFPLTEPYYDLGYTYTGHTGPTSIAPWILMVTGRDAIVDWMVIELHAPGALGTVAYSRPVLVQRDGDLVDLDGINAPVLPNLPLSSYHVVVRHRNHLPAMTWQPVVIHEQALVDFIGQAASAASTTTLGYLTKGLWMGDVNSDDLLKYVGSGNDRDPILTSLGGSVPTATVSGYRREDVNMDGLVRYVGPDNDRDPILQNIGGNVPTSVRSAQLP